MTFKKGCRTICSCYLSPGREDGVWYAPSFLPPSPFPSTTSFAYSLAVRNSIFSISLPLSRHLSLVPSIYWRQPSCVVREQGCCYEDMRYPANACPVGYGLWDLGERRYTEERRNITRIATSIESGDNHSFAAYRGPPNGSASSGSVTSGSRIRKMISPPPQEKMKLLVFY